MHTVEYGEETQQSWSGCSGARMPRYLRGGALAILRAPPRHRGPADPPVVGVDLVDDDHRGLRVFSEDVHERLRHAADHLGLLLCRGPLPRDLDVHVRHPVLLPWLHQTKRSSSPAPRRRALTRMRHAVPGAKTNRTGSLSERKKEAIAAIEGRCPTHRMRPSSPRSSRNARNASGVALGARAAVSAILTAGEPAASAQIAAVWIARFFPLAATRSKGPVFPARDSTIARMAPAPSGESGRAGSSPSGTASPFPTSPTSITPNLTPPP